MIIEKSLKIKFIQKCKCGAVTYGRDIQDVMGGVTGGAGVYG